VFLENLMPSPKLTFGLLTFLAAVILAAVLAVLGLDVVISWLAAITLVTLLAYGYDKFVAGSRRTRIPEAVLLALTFAGGTLGALLGRWLFHHKTAKGSFRLKFWLVVALQVTLLAGYLFWLRPLLETGPGPS
jgi:uncharacterized membrane protein YsdA (DUF1294 family)